MQTALFRTALTSLRKQATAGTAALGVEKIYDYWEKRIVSSWNNTALLPSSINTSKSQSQVLQGSSPVGSSTSLLDSGIDCHCTITAVNRGHKMVSRSCFISLSVTAVYGCGDVDIILPLNSKPWDSILIGCVVGFVFSCFTVFYCYFWFC